MKRGNVVRIEDEFYIIRDVMYNYEDDFCQIDSLELMPFSRENEVLFILRGFPVMKDGVPDEEYTIDNIKVVAPTISEFITTCFKEN